MTFAAIVTADTLEEFLAPVSALVDECKINLGTEGIEIRAVDPANVAMCQADLDAGAFESYEADGGTIGVNLDRLEDVIGFADSGDLVHLELNEQTRKLDVQVSALDYTLALIDPDSIRQEPDIPDLDLPAEVVVEGQDLQLMAEASDIVSDHISLGVDAGRGVFYSNAEGDTDDASIELDEDDVIDRSGSGARSLFSLDYITDVTGAMPDEVEVRVILGDEFPIKMYYDLAEGRASVTSLVAPRIQSED